MNDITSRYQIEGRLLTAGEAWDRYVGRPPEQLIASYDAIKTADQAYEQADRFAFQAAERDQLGLGELATLTAALHHCLMLWYCPQESCSWGPARADEPRAQLTVEQRLERLEAQLKDLLEVVEALQNPERKETQP